MKKFVAATLAGAFALAVVASNAPHAEASSGDAYTAKLMFSDSQGSDGTLRTAANKVHARLIPSQKKQCGVAALEFGILYPVREVVTGMGGLLGAQDYFKVRSVGKSRTLKVWNGSKYVKEKGARTVKVRVGIWVATREPEMELERANTSVTVIRHKYWALRKSAMEDCERAQRWVNAQPAGPLDYTRFPGEFASYRAPLEDAAVLYRADHGDDAVYVWRTK